MTSLKLFESKEIRSVWNDVDQKWYFSVADVVMVLTDSTDPKAYWRQLKRREAQLVTNCHGFKLTAADGKKRMEDCANTEELFSLYRPQNPIMIC